MREISCGRPSWFIGTFLPVHRPCGGGHVTHATVLPAPTILFWLVTPAEQRRCSLSSSLSRQGVVRGRDKLVGCELH